MEEYNFYSLNDDAFLGTVSRLIDKVFNSGHRILVYGTDVELLKELDKSLWTFSTNAFIPHGWKDIGSPDLQAVWISDEIQNPNGSDVLLLLNNFRLFDDFVFEKILLVFDKQHEKEAGNTYLDLKNSEKSVNYWEQSLKGWNKKE